MEKYEYDASKCFQNTISFKHMQINQISHALDVNAFRETNEIPLF